jgi:endonuclease/exonuclease/phosphatase family metal-dependent hydrolase
VDLEAAAEAVAALGADVVALQEVDRGLPRTGGVDQVAELAARTGLHGVFAPALLGDPDTRWTAVGDGDAGGAGYGVGLLSRVPLRDVRRVALPGGGDGQRSPRASLRNPGWDREPRVALVAALEVGGAALRVATAHLSYLPWRGLAQLRTAAAAVAALDGPAALIGDLNLPAWPVRTALPGSWTHVPSAPTYPAWRPRVAVDQLAVRGGLTASDVTVGPRATSDHLPLLATLTLPAATARGLRRG